MGENEQKIGKRFEAVSASRTFRNIRMRFGLERVAVLDLGCSYGEFLAHFGPESVGVTVSPEEASYAKERGLAVVLGNVEDDTFAASLGKKFDIIFANNLFEHLYSPHAFLIRSKELLDEEGRLILGVPCVPKFAFLMRFAKFRGSLASQHINFFTRETLRLTVERAGWIVEDVRGFHFASPFIDHLFDFIYPHFYVIAHPDLAFEYSKKRQKELEGYAEKHQEAES